MGSRPHAVLAYGYDLSDDFSPYDKAEPAWLTDPDASWHDNAARALLAAAGASIAPGEYFNPDDTQKLCGVTLIKLGYDDESSVILAVEHHETDWDQNIAVPPPAARPAGKLAWALGVLGLERNTEPTWLLGTWYG